MRIDLNCDMGESFGAYRLGDDEAVLRSVTSASIACGFHAGDPSVIRRTLRLAKSAGVAVGAHPGFPDLVGFGRREMRMAPREVEDLVLYQVAALAGMAAAEGMALTYVKPHGALHNMAGRDRELADAIVAGIAAMDRSLVLVGLAGSEMLAAGRAAGLTIASEGFADRAYEPDGSLASRSKPGSVISDPEIVVARALRLVRDRSIVALDGSVLALHADTVCVHGDTPGAGILAARLRAGLEAAGVTVAPIGAGAAGAGNGP